MRRRRGHDRLGHRSDTEDGVAPHRLALATGFHTERTDVYLVVPADQRDDAGHVAALDMAGPLCIRTSENTPSTLFGE
jgi:hypothetical protein